MRRSSLRILLTLVGVSISTLVGLGAVVALVQALVTTGYGDSVIAGQVPGLLGGTGVRLPDLGGHIVALRYTSVERKVGTGEDD